VFSDAARNAALAARQTRSRVYVRLDPKEQPTAISKGRRPVSDRFASSKRPGRARL
jgi:hypothetical protein